MFRGTAGFQEPGSEQNSGNRASGLQVSGSPGFRQGPGSSAEVGREGPRRFRIVLVQLPAKVLKVPRSSGAIATGRVPAGFGREVREVPVQLPGQVPEGSGKFWCVCQRRFPKVPGSFGAVTKIKLSLDMTRCSFQAQVPEVPGRSSAVAREASKNSRRVLASAGALSMVLEVVDWLREVHDGSGALGRPRFRKVPEPAKGLGMFRCSWLTKVPDGLQKCWCSWQPRFRKVPEGCALRRPHCLSPCIYTVL